MIKTYYKIKGILTTALLMLFCFAGAKSCSEDYFNGNDEERVAQYETMLRDSTIVTAIVDDEYTETTIAKSLKSYTYTYHYQVDGKDYVKEITSEYFPPYTVIELFYSKTDPSLSTRNPKQSIKEEGEDASIWTLVWAIVWGLLAIIFLMSLIAQIFGKDEDEKTEEVIEA